MRDMTAFVELDSFFGRGESRAEAHRAHDLQILDHPISPNLHQCRLVNPQTLIHTVARQPGLLAAVPSKNDKGILQ
jgi:hypothetical protein